MSLDNGYVTSDYLKKVAEKMRAFKQLSYEHMAITAGDTVLDLGCGPGVDTVPLAGLVGNKGKVIGIDTDEKMLAEAKQAALDVGCHDLLEHCQGSATALELADNSVASCRAERLLQVLPPDQEQTIVAEMVRVTRPGGRVVLVDTDWPSASVDFSDVKLERTLMEFFTLHMRPNGLAGRHLLSLCNEHGLEDIHLDVVPMVQQRFDETPFGDWLINTAKEQGIINESEATQWHEELQQREHDRSFYACVNMVIASGRKGTT
jgi:ubiquinone/menaquinone biosynthesis C-methylase UbiE